MLELPVLAILVNFDTLLYCTRTIVDTKEYSISNVFSACSGVVMYFICSATTVNGVMKSISLSVLEAMVAGPSWNAATASDCLCACVD